jgi:hypothetical protein
MDTSNNIPTGKEISKVPRASVTATRRQNAVNFLFKLTVKEKP